MQTTSKERTKQQVVERQVMATIASTLPQKERERYSDGVAAWQPIWDDPTLSRAKFTIKCDCGYVFSCVSPAIALMGKNLYEESLTASRMVAREIIDMIRSHNQHHDGEHESHKPAKNPAKKPAKFRCKACGDTLDEYPPWEGPCAHDKSPYKPFAKLIKEYRL